jgi:hypothetical protein
MVIKSRSAFQDHVGSEVLAAVVMKSSVFWDIMPCDPLRSPNGFDKHADSIFRDEYAEQKPPAFVPISYPVYPSNPEDGGNTYIRNVCFNGLHNRLFFLNPVYIGGKPFQVADRPYVAFTSHRKPR